MSPRPGVVPDLQQLRDRVRHLERPTPGVELARSPGLRGLPGLRGGSSVEVSDLGLAMALLAGPTSGGSWCAVVGVPDFGAEAAAGLGVDLSRVVLVPEPTEQWLEVVAALVDVVSLVLLRPCERVSDGTAARLSARLRRRDAVLLVQGEAGAWPRCELRLRTTRTAWSGVGEGHGRLRVRDLEVQVREGARPPRLVPVRLVGRSDGLGGTWERDATGAIQQQAEGQVSGAATGPRRGAPLHPVGEAV